MGNLGNGPSRYLMVLGYGSGSSATKKVRGDLRQVMKEKRLKKKKKKNSARCSPRH